MSKNAELWLAYADKLEASAKEIFFQTDIDFLGASDPKAVGAMLFARNYSNFIAINLLIKSNKITEARILLRSSIENFLWISAIITKRDNFVKEMISDDVKSRQGLSKFIEEKIDGIDGRVAERLKDAKSFWNMNWPKPSMLRPNDVARESPIESIYLLYKKLCLTVAHPTITALSRHLVQDNQNGNGIDFSPNIENFEYEDTIFETCLVMLGLIVAFGQLTEKKLFRLTNQLVEEFERLQS